MLMNYRMNKLTHNVSSPFLKWAISFNANQMMTHACQGSELQKILDWDSQAFKAWLAHTQPDIDFYYNAIIAEDGFKSIQRADKIAIGHVLVIKQGHDAQGHDAGKLMLARNFPRALPSSADNRVRKYGSM